MTKIKKAMSILLMLTMVFAFAGCTKEAPVATTEEVAVDAAAETTETEAAVEEVVEEVVETEEAVTLSGEITISGSTSVEKIGIAEAEEFMALNPDVTITYESIGSSAGVKNANEGVSMLGTSSRELKKEEKAWGMNEVVIAFDGIAVVTHPSNGIADLTMDQIKGIFTGTITNWSEVGGADAEIVVVSREDGSGTRGAFEELVDFEGGLVASALVSEGNGNVQTTVAGNPNAIGYVSFTYLDDTIKAVTVEGIAPTAEDVLNGTFPISRPFVLCYHEENIDETTQAFIDFILAEDGQAIVEENGGIKVK